MGMTMTEKILARKSGSREVRPGDIVVCEVDLAVQIDVGFQMPNQVFDPERIVLVADHAVPAPTVEAAGAHAAMREASRRFGIRHLHDVGRHGIVHQVLAEGGYALPGTLLAAGDSHSCAAGAFNCAARGLGGPEMLYVLAAGRTWFMVGPTVRFVLEGELPDLVSARDVFHWIAGEYGDFVGHNIEYAGPAVRSMSIAARQNLATMAAELSAEFALFEADDRTMSYLRERTDAEFEPVYPDADAEYEAEYTVNLSELAPQVILPDRVPKNARPARDLAGVRITQAFIGSCANGRLEDLAIAARLLKGRKIHPDVRLIVTPSSQAEYLRAVQAGYVETIVEAGGVVTSSTCGACGGFHMGVLGPTDVCITASTRNFPGRMGSPTARIFLGSPATVAASAVRGEISDPRELS